MPDLDLEPKDYRAEPLRREPVFASGGLKRLAIYAGFVALGIGFSMIFQPIAHEVITWVRAAVGR